MRMSDDNPNNHGRTDNADIPTHLDLIPPTLRVVIELGGSAHISEITEAIINTYPNGEELAEIRYSNKPKRSVFRHEAYSAAGETWFGWWLVEHYFSYHVNCPDGCVSGEPARGG